MKQLPILLIALLFAGLLSAQNVGINTTAPQATLDVNGTLKVGSLGSPSTQMVVSDPSGNLSVQPIPASTSYTAGAGISISGTTISNTSPDQPVSLNGSGATTVSGSYPNFTVSSTDAVNDADADPANELQTLGLSGNSLSLTSGGSVDLSSFLDNTDAQSLSLSGSTVSLTNGGSVDLTPLLPSQLWTEAAGNIFRSTGKVLIGSNSTPTHTFMIDSPDTLAMRILGPGSVDSKARINFGDANYVYIEEDLDDRLTIHAATRLSLMGGNVGVGTLTAPYDLTINGDIGAVNPSGEVRILSDVDASDVGNFFTYGPTSVNTRLGRLNGFPNHGFLSIWDNTYNTNTTPKAGMTIDASGFGTVFADIKNFRMAHPTQPGKEIWYASVEGPEAAAYERGTAQLVNGKAVVTFSDHFQLVANPDGMTVMLTPLSGESRGMAVIQKTQSGFEVLELMGATGTYQFDWEVKCVRKGFEDYQVIRNTEDMMPAPMDPRTAPIVPVKK